MRWACLHAELLLVDALRTEKEAEKKFVLPFSRKLFSGKICIQLVEKTRKTRILD